MNEKTVRSFYKAIRQCMVEDLLENAQCAQRLQKVFWVIFAFQISLTESDQKLSEFSNKKRIKVLSFLRYFELNTPNWYEIYV